MKRFIVISLFALLLAPSAIAQKYMTKTGKIRFYSEAPLEKIEAVNNQVNAAFDPGTGDLVFKVLIKSFIFEKALMQEHFNENYMESAKFPNATFMGKVTNIQKFDPSKSIAFEAEIEGKLTIHGVTRDVQTKGTLTPADGKINGHAVFSVAVKDYDIKIPTAVVKNIAENIEITVDIVLEKLN
jgi:polyisoprenoid-binding protein YceI